jgi:hypothetical protein
VAKGVEELRTVFRCCLCPRKTTQTADALPEGWNVIMFTTPGYQGADHRWRMAETTAVYVCPSYHSGKVVGL